MASWHSPPDLAERQGGFQRGFVSAFSILRGCEQWGIDQREHDHSARGQQLRGTSGAVHFVWEMWRFKLAAKLTTRNPGACAKLPARQQQILWTPVGGGARSPQVPEIFDGFQVNCHPPPPQAGGGGVRVGGCLCPLSCTFLVALHTTTFLGVSENFTPQTPGASAEFPTAKFTTGKLTRHKIPTPPVRGK